MYRKRCQLIALALIAASCLNVTAQEPAKDSKVVAVQGNSSVAEIETAIKSYVAAFNTRDVEKLVAHWSPNGVYTSRTGGEQVVGRKAMIEEFKKSFQGGIVPTLAVETESIKIISPSVAIERGKAIVTHGKGDVIESTYSVVYMKSDNAWLIDRVTEEEIFVEDTHYDELKDLEWLVGDWLHEGDGFRVESSCQWTTKKNFISRKFKVLSGENDVESSGLQIIGWDEKEKQVRSWLFDSDGGVVTGDWRKRGNRWVVQSVATLADGRSGSFSSSFRPMAGGGHAWEKTNRVLDGRVLPNLDEMIFQRN